MQIELMGCTGAGKSTLAQRIIAACHDQGMDIAMGDDVVLAQVGLSGVTDPRLRKALLNLLALSAGLATWRTHHGVYRFATRYLARLPIGIPGKLNVLRGVIKRVGIHEIIRRRADGRIVLVDEGVLQAAHYLFVHLSAPPPGPGVSEFARLAPLPDAIVYVTQPEARLVARTIKRGHRRIPDRSPGNVSRFIGGAVATFDRLARHRTIADRLLVVDGGQTVRPAVDGRGSPSLDLALRVVRAGLAYAAADGAKRG